MGGGAYLGKHGFPGPRWAIQEDSLHLLHQVAPVQLRVLQRLDDSVDLRPVITSSAPHRVTVSGKADSRGGTAVMSSVAVTDGQERRCSCRVLTAGLVQAGFQTENPKAPRQKLVAYQILLDPLIAANLLQGAVYVLRVDDLHGHILQCAKAHQATTHQPILSGVMSVKDIQGLHFAEPRVGQTATVRVLHEFAWIVCVPMVSFVF